MDEYFNLWEQSAQEYCWAHGKEPGQYDVFRNSQWWMSVGLNPTMSLEMQKDCMDRFVAKMNQAGK